jgi:hypothetical protein
VLSCLRTISRSIVTTQRLWYGLELRSTDWSGGSVQDHSSLPTELAVRPTDRFHQTLKYTPLDARGCSRAGWGVGSCTGSRVRFPLRAWMFVLGLCGLLPRVGREALRHTSKSPTVRRKNWLREKKGEGKGIIMKVQVSEGSSKQFLGRIVFESGCK